MRLKLQPEGELFPCCDGTEEISQSSSNDTPAPERTVCQPCSTGSQLVPPTRAEEDNEKEVLSSEVAEGLSEGGSEQEDESQEEVSEDEEQEKQVKNDEQEETDVEGVGHSDSTEEASEDAETVEEENNNDAEEAEEPRETIKSGKLIADAAPVDESKVSVEKIFIAADEPDVAKTKKVEKAGEKLPDPVPEEPVRKSSVKGTRF